MNLLKYQLTGNKMVSTSPLGIFTTDANLIITSWNDWLEKATGISEESARGLPLIRVIPDIEKRGLLDRFYKVLTFGSVELLTASFHHFLIRIPFPIPVGEYSEMQQRVTISALFDEETTCGTLVTIEDVTDEFVHKAADISTTNIDDLGSNKWEKRSDTASTLADSGRLIISEVLRKIRLEHRNPAILSSAMKVILMSDENINDLLIEFLRDPDSELRIYAAQMLGSKNSPEVVEALIMALDDADINVRYHAIESLGKLCAVTASERLASIALERNFFTSFPAVDALRAIGDSRTARLLFPIMDDDLLGQPVLEALGEFGELDAVPHMTEKINKDSFLIPHVVLALTMMNERYEQTFGEKYVVANSITAHIDKNGISNLLSHLNRSNLSEVELRSLITVIGWIDEKETRKALTRFLGHSGTCKLVIDALVASGHKVIDLLISQLYGENDTRQSAIMALGRIGGMEAGEALIPLLSDDEVAAISCGALAKIGDKRAFEPLLNLLGHSNAIIRRSAIAALNSIGHPEMEKVITSMLNNKNPFIRDSALRIAGYFGFQSSKTFVQQLVSDMEINVRVAAIENLPFFEDERMTTALICLYSDENPKIREAVVKSLGQVESKQAWLVLATAIEDSDEWVRYYAVKSVDNHGYIDIMDKIKGIAQADPVPFVRLAAIEYLGHIGGSLSVSILSSLTGDQNHDIAIASVSSLGDIHHPDALPPLLALSKSVDYDLRKSALESLGRRGGPGTAEVLQWAALTEKDFVMRNIAITGLKNISSEETVNALLNLTSDAGNREKAICALASLPARMLSFIAEGLDHKHSLVRTAVVEVLLRIHSPQASEILALCLEHQDVDVRLSTIYALHKLGNQKHIKKILALKESDPDPVVRRTVEDIIRTSSELI